MNVFQHMALELNNLNDWIMHDNAVVWELNLSVFSSNLRDVYISVQWYPPNSRESTGKTDWNCQVRRRTGSQVDVILNKEARTDSSFIGVCVAVVEALGEKCSCPVCTTGYATEGTVKYGIVLVRIKQWPQTPRPLYFVQVSRTDYWWVNLWHAHDSSNKK